MITIFGFRIRDLTRSVAVFLAVAGASLSQALADNAPHSLNFSGFLTDSAGAPLTGTNPLRFGIYLGSTRVWYAEYQNVKMSEGQFSVTLGWVAQGGEALDPSTGTPILNQNLPITSSLLSSVTSAVPVEIQVEVWNGSSFDTLSPSFPVSSAMFALQAETVGGYDSSHLAKIDGSGNILAQGGTPVVNSSGYFVGLVNTPSANTDAANKQYVDTHLGTRTLDSVTSPSAGQVLKFDGTKWAPSSALSSQWTSSGSNIYYTTGKVGIGTSSFGTNTVLQVNPASTADNLATSQISASSASNKGLVVQGATGQSASLQEWQDSTGATLSFIDSLGKFHGDGSALTNVTATNFSGSLSGDVTGTQTSTTVAKIRGIPVSSTAPTANQILQYDGTSWVPAPAPATGVTTFNTRSGSVTLSSADVTGALTYTPVNKAGDSMTGALNIAASSDSKQLTIKANAGQTQNLQEWQNGSGSAVSYVDSTGKIHGDGSNLTNVTATSMAAGNITGQVAVANGGTGASSLTAHGVLVGEGSSPVVATAAGTAGYPLVSGGAGADPNFAQLDLTSAVTGVLPVASGGTGASSFTAGSIPFSDGTILTQDNSNFFWDSTNKRLGIGTSAPANGSSLNISTNGNAVILNDSYGSGTSATYQGRMARGTQSAPTAAQTGDSLVSLGGRGYGTTGFGSGASGGVFVKAAENFTDSANGSYLSFETTPQGSTSSSRAERMRIDDQGNVGIGTTAPNDALSFGALNASATHSLVNLSNTALSGASASGTYIGANPSVAGPDLIHYQVAGTTKFKVDNTGRAISGSSVQVGSDASSCTAANTGAISMSGANLQYCNGTSWTTLAASGAGITSLNGLSSNSQSFAIGTTGNSPAFISSGSTHTLNIPLASTSSVTAGLLGNTDFANFNSAYTATNAATSSNTTSTIVKRDGSGNFSAGTITANLIGNVTGNATNVTGTVAVANGGTGATTLTAHGVLVGEGTSALAVTGAGTSGYPLISGGAGADPSFAQLSLLTGVTDTLPVANGGTGATSTSQNFVFAGPASGGPGTPSFRALAASDLPSLSGTYLPLSGGTMSGSITMGGNTLYGVSTSAGNLTLDSTSNSTKGSVILAPSGGNVAIGTTSPSGFFDVEGGTAGAGTNGSNVVIAAQNGGAGNQNGGKVTLLPGNATGSGTAGSVSVGNASNPSALNITPWANGSSIGLMGLGGTSNVGMTFTNSSNAGGLQKMSLNYTSGGLLQFQDRADGGSLTANRFNFDKVNGTLTIQNNASTNLVQLNMSGNSYFNGGNLGIGTSSPAYTLSAQNSSGASQLQLKNSTYAGYLTAQSSEEGLMSSGGAYFDGTNTIATTTSAIEGVTAASGFKIYGDTGLTMGNSFTPTIRFAVTPSGNVGIGTTSPVDSLSFNSVNPSATHASINLSNTALAGGSVDGTYIGANPASAGADFINYQVGGSSKFQVDSNGNVTATSFSGTVSSGAISGLVATANGGTGKDSSAWTGVPSVSGGSWSINSQLPTTLGGLGGNFGASSGALSVSGGTVSAGTLSVGNGGTGSTSYSAGSIPYSNGTILTQDNSNLFWDSTNKRLGIGTSTPGASLDLSGGAIQREIASGSAPTATAGQAMTYADSTSHTLRLSVNGGSYSDVITSATMTTAINTAVSGTANSIPKFTSTNVIGNSKITDNGTLTTVSEAVSVAVNDASNPGIKVVQSNSGPAATFSGGKVGIGSTSPGYNLDVADNTTNGRAANITQSSASGTAYGVYASATGGATTNTAGYFTASGGSNNYALITGSGQVGIGTSTPNTSAALTVQGQIVSNINDVASGGTCNMSLANVCELEAVGGNTITLSNMVKGGAYTVIVNDTTSRTYSFSGCTTTSAIPTLSATNGRQIYTILLDANSRCFITWIQGF